MSGPFPNIRAWCDQAEIRQTCVTENQRRLRRGGASRTLPFTCQEQATKSAPLPPYQAIAVIKAHCDTDDVQILYFEALELAVRVDGKWYLGEIDHRVETQRQSETTEVASIEVRSLVAGGPPRVVLQLKQSLAYRGRHELDSELMLIAGIGQSGKPSLTGPLLLSQTTYQQDDEAALEKERVHRKEVLKVEFLPGEVVQIGGPAPEDETDIDRQTLRSLLGKHTLAFP